MNGGGEKGAALGHFKMGGICSVVVLCMRGRSNEENGVIAFRPALRQSWGVW